MMFIAQNGSKWDDSLQSQMALESPAVDGPLVLPALLIETLHAAGAESAKRLLGGPLAFPWRFRAHGNDVCLVLILSIYVYIYIHIFIYVYTHAYIIYIICIYYTFLLYLPIPPITRPCVKIQDSRPTHVGHVKHWRVQWSRLSSLTPTYIA
jgi:hypothetical protein